MFITQKRIRSVGGDGGGGGGSGSSSSSINVNINAVCNCLMQLLVALQMLMTFEMPLSTTMALPVTSKPIESTAENLAWQAWIMLPPEQKQLMKSRKVTPKSIFTLPLRVECPEGHQQVDTKCIPTVIGSNSVLIDPHVLGLVLGNAPTDIEYDYEDEGADDKQAHADTMSFNPPLYLSDPMGEEKVKDELKPPSQDAPLKFNIFQSKFPTDDYAMEDYSVMSSNEGSGGQTQEMETNGNGNLQSNATAMAAAAAFNDTSSISISLNITANITTTHRDLVSEASNVSKVHTFTTLPDSNDFNLDDIDAISLPASGSHEEHSHKISLFKEDSSLHLVTSDIDSESTAATAMAEGKEKDLETLLQTESLMPMINQTATTPENILLTTTLAGKQEEEQEEEEEERVMTDALSDEAPSLASMDFNVDGGEEITTTLPQIIDKDMDTMETQDKAEFIRSVTMNTLTSSSANGDDDAVGFGIEVTTTLTPSSSYNDAESSVEKHETTTTSPIIQLDETTIIEGNNDESASLSSVSPGLTPTTMSPSLPASSASSVSASIDTSASLMSPPTLQPVVAEELTTLLWHQEQALKDFEELQRMRKGQHKDQHMVMKKSKVEPVEVLVDATTMTTVETMPSGELTTTTTNELITTTETETETATVTPLLKVVNNNDKNNNKHNDRFYYQHIANKQDLKSSVRQQQPSSTTPAPPASAPANAWSTGIETLASSSTTTTKTTATTTTMTGMGTASNGEKSSEIDLLAQELRLINDLVKGKRPTRTTTTTTTPKINISSASTSAIVTATPTLGEPTSTVDGIKILKATPTTSTTPKSFTGISESSVNSIKTSRTTAEIWSKIMPLLTTSSTTTTTTTPTTTTIKPPLKTTTSESLAESSAAITEEEGTTTFKSFDSSSVPAPPPPTPMAVVSNRSHRNSKIIRIDGLNTIKATPKTYAAAKQTITTKQEDILSTITTPLDSSSSMTVATSTKDDDDDDVSSSSSNEDSSYESFWWLPTSWRLDRPSSSSSTSPSSTTTTTTRPEQVEGSSEDLPLLLRFWSAYHAPKSS